MTNYERTADIAVEDKDSRSPIDRATQQIHRELMQLAEAVDGLGSRLGPFLRPSEPSPKDALTVARDSASEHTNSLRDAVERAQELQRRIGDLHNRLEI